MCFARYPFDLSPWIKVVLPAPQGPTTPIIKDFMSKNLAVEWETDIHAPDIVSEIVCHP